MLKLRIITAVVLLAIIGMVLFFMPPVALSLLLVAVFAVAAWEWANFADIRHPALRILYALVFVGVVALLVRVSGILSASADLLLVRDVLGLGCTWWALALLWVMSYPASAIFWRHSVVKMLMGLLVLVPSVLALLHVSQQASGQWLFLYLVGIVVTADVGAYIFGRWLGRSKLAPRVSPGKSWAGFWGGLACTLMYAVVVAMQVPVAGLSLPALVLVSGIAALASVLGDLLESMLKRERGLKDSSQLLPGHGGFMDRIDSITAAAPVFTLLTLLLQAN